MEPVQKELVGAGLFFFFQLEEGSPFRGPPIKGPIREPHSGTPIKGTHQGTFRETPFMGKTLCKGMRVSSDTQPGDRRRVAGTGWVSPGKFANE